MKLVVGGTVGCVDVTRGVVVDVVVDGVVVVVVVVSGVVVGGGGVDVGVVGCVISANYYCDMFN